MIFLDTSILVAVAQVSHMHHRESARLFNFLEKKNTSVSCHTLAETYAALTAAPPSKRLPPKEGIATIETFLKRVTPVSLSSEEYLETITSAARLGHTSGMVYDALHLACARKCKADHIYTWNLKHFRSLAPDLADRILTP